MRSRSHSNPMYSHRKAEITPGTRGARRNTCARLAFWLQGCFFALACRRRSPQFVQEEQVPYVWTCSGRTRKQMVPVLLSFLHQYRDYMRPVVKNQIIHAVIPTLQYMEARRSRTNMLFNFAQNLNTTTQVIVPVIVGLSGRVSLTDTAWFWVVQSLLLINLLSMTGMKMMRKQHGLINKYSIRIEDEVTAAMLGTKYYSKNMKKGMPWLNATHMCHAVRVHYSRYRQNETQAQHAAMEAAVSKQEKKTGQQPPRPAQPGAEFSYTVQDSWGSGGGPSPANPGYNTMRSMRRQASIPPQMPTPVPVPAPDAIAEPVVLSKDALQALQELPRQTDGPVREVELTLTRGQVADHVQLGDEDGSDSMSVTTNVTNRVEFQDDLVAEDAKRDSPAHHSDKQ